MAENNLVNDIEKGFKALGGGLKDAGRKRNLDIAAKNGYVAFRSPEAVAALKADPFYKDWTYKQVGDEHRFYPPQIAKDKSTGNDNNADVRQDSSLQVNPIIDTYKKATNEVGYSYVVSIIMLKDDPTKCQYKLIKRDKMQREEVLQELYIPFDGAFSTTVLPSLYYQISGGLPVIDNEKDGLEGGSVTFSNVKGDKTILLGRLSPSQVQVVKMMKEFVDTNNLNLPKDVEETQGFHI